MPYNGSGIFSRVYNWVSDKNNAINITASRVDTEDTGFATGLSNCICKDGQTTVTANIPFAGFKLTGVGPGTALTDAMNVSQSQGGLPQYLTGTAGTNTVTAVSSPVFAAYATGQTFRIIPAVTNTSATTLNINSLGAISLRAKTGAGLIAFIGGEWVAGQEYDIFYDGTFFQSTPTYGNLNVTSTVVPATGIYRVSSVTTGISANTALGLQVKNQGVAPFNYLEIGNFGSGFSNFISSKGADTNIDQTYQTQGTGRFFYQTAGGTTQFEVAHTASATNYPIVTGSNGGAPTLSTSGGDLALNSATGHVTVPTESAGDNSTRAASTAFVTTATVFTKSFQSTAQTMTAGSGASIAHSLGGRPKIIYAYIRCLTAELNYAIGDEVPFPIEFNGFGVNAWSDGTANIRYWISASFRIPNATTGGDNAITYANWQLFIRAYA